MQPLAPHQHWHIDFSFINIAATFYYLCSVLDGCSRYIVCWDIRTSMEEADAEIVLQRGREAYPQARPQIISDRGSQFVLCEKSKTDPNFPRYPRLPVLACTGYEAQ